jgi:peptidoglycan biosynthesis protein MviN/MurJ (putative lipid II flippase)
MAGGKDGWNDSKLIARAILHDRAARRKVMARMLLIALALMAVGLWLIDVWLAKNPWWFLLWWGACAVITVGVMLFALYDALAVIREEREKFRKQ